MEYFWLFTHEEFTEFGPRFWHFETQEFMEYFRLFTREEFTEFGPDFWTFQIQEHIRFSWLFDTDFNPFSLGHLMEFVHMILDHIIEFKEPKKYDLLALIFQVKN